MTDVRTSSFAERGNDRYWWFRAFKPAYDPPIFAMLSDAEWSILDAWYNDTGEKFPVGTGECGIPALSMLHGIIAGNRIRRIVQLGHFIGFSSLIIGFLLRRMQLHRALYSIDIDMAVTQYTQSWIGRAGLSDQVGLVVADSADEQLPALAANYLGGAPQLIFIDSSHQYDHTLKELELWYPALQPGGLIAMHDISRFAASFDHTGAGGVAAALSHWLPSSDARSIMLNGDLIDQSGDALCYTDGCGLALLQKPFNRAA